MLETAVKFKIKNGEKVYEFHFPADAPLGEIHDALFQMRTFVINKINEAMKADAPKEPEAEQPKE